LREKDPKAEQATTDLLMKRGKERIREVKTP
jgi:hypothetical protein